jgi:SAM-dependent methyltransferase
VTSSDEQTRYSFLEKWKNNPELGFRLTQAQDSNFQQWILNRNGCGDKEAFAKELSKYSRILDAGCGNGRVTALLASLAPHAQVIGVDITDLSIPRKNTREFPNVEYAYADLRNDLSHLGVFDYIYCQEVLHHTGDARGSFGNLVRILRRGGKIAIYVYRKKAPAREFMDDYIRNQISSMSYEEAMKICRQIASLGRKLDAIDAEIEVDDIPAIGIVKGRYTVQRLMYHFFMKCYWNPDLSEEENSAINYDWYHPQNCSRHTMEEVLQWFSEEKLTVVLQFEDMYGIVVHGVSQ